MPLLKPAALLYRGVLAGWRLGMALGGGPRGLPVPVVSVGNLVVGGTGKTPAALWIGEHLVRRGKRPAILARGYGGRAGRGPLVVSDGERALCDSADCGDEPAMLARRARGISIVVGSDRHSCGIHAVERLGADCIILDDGFQHLGLLRDLNLLLMDSSRPFGTGELLPAGTLRETPDQIVRADIVIFTRWDRRSNGESHRGRVASVIGEKKIVKASHKFAGLFEVYPGSGRALLHAGGTRAEGTAANEGSPSPVTEISFSGSAGGKPALLVTGIADWRSFRDTVEGAGFEARDHICFSDHHRYTARDVRSIRARTSRCGAALVLTTEKDAVRLPHEVREIEVPVLCARVDLEIEEGLDVLREALDGIFSWGGSGPVGRSCYSSSS